MRTIAVLFGGQSTEYDVSLQSAYAVIEHMDLKKYQPVLVGITRDGEWLLFEGSIEKIAADTWHDDPSCCPAILSPSRKNFHDREQESGCVMVFGPDSRKLIPIDCVFPMLHGKNGEDGTVQGLLELAGVPVVGCKTLSSAICMDKEIAHTLVEAAGISVPQSMTLHRDRYFEREILETASEMGFPLFVKPARAGSSFGITKVTEPNTLNQAIHMAFQHDSKVVIEKAVEGFEVGCAVLGNGQLKIGRVDEIQLSQGFFDYTEKYTLKSSKIHMPARIDEVTEERIKKAAEVIYRVLECSGFARVDMFLTPQREIVFNEVNTIPGFTSHSRYPNMMRGIGMEFSQIIDEVIELAFEE